MSNLINGRYTLDTKIGYGSFGDVYIGYDKIDNHLVAIKLESSSRNLILKHEYDIYQEITGNASLKMPTIYWYGVIEGGKKAMVMEFMGNSLEYLFTKKCKGVFSIKTTLMVGIKILKLLQGLHECNYIHRDIKPDNFLTALKGKSHDIYLIDLGLAKRYKSQSHVHLKQTEGKRIVGTVRYSSINSHLGIELSRRDDLESLGYMLIYFINGSLPWQGLAFDEKDKEDKYKLIGRMKQETSIDTLCKGLPPAFHDYMSHVRTLSFKERPNYKYLYDVLMKSFFNLGFVWDKYDWEYIK